jgi:hypothetical protein
MRGFIVLGNQRRDIFGRWGRFDRWPEFFALAILFGRVETTICRIG